MQSILKTMFTFCFPPLLRKERVTRRNFVVVVVAVVACCRILSRAANHSFPTRHLHNMSLHFNYFILIALKRLINKTFLQGVEGTI